MFNWFKTNYKFKIFRVSIARMGGRLLKKGEIITIII